MNRATLNHGNMVLTIVDDLDPEITAMLQAFYSRSHMPINMRLEELGDKEDKIRESLNRFYLGYGHQSIADCGFTTIFIENVSMLAAKAIQDNSLYNGQEASTRYIDFSNQPIMPELQENDNSDTNTVFYKLRKTQNELVERSKQIHVELTEKFKSERPLKEGENESVWNNAMRAKAFDIIRGLLPAGVTTQLAWTTSLRKARENIIRLYMHPLDEVRLIAHNMWTLFRMKYPNTFEEFVTDAIKSPEVRDWMQSFYAKNTYAVNVPHIGNTCENDITFKWVPNYSLDEADKLPAILNMLKSRPKGAEVPPFFNMLGQFVVTTVIDYGCFRDIQRHRVGTMPMPMLKLPENNRLHSFYMNNLQDYEDEIMKRIEEIRTLVSSREFIECSPNPEADTQYYVPMGCPVDVTFVYPLAQAIYVSELRSKDTVHPILRAIATYMTDEISRYLDIPVYCGNTHLDSIHRGTQTIMEKKDAAT